VDKRLGFQLKHVPRREGEWEIEEDGVGSCTSEIVHPVRQHSYSRINRPGRTSWLDQCRYPVSRLSDSRTDR